MNDSYLFDTHFHLDLHKDIQALVERIEKSKTYTIAVTNSPTVFDHTFKLCQSTKFIRPAIGLHPELVQERYNEIDLLKEKITKTKYVGEVGLDYKNASNENMSKQKIIFEEILDLCRSGGKVLTIHSRGAEEDVINMIGSNFRSKVILHWYSGKVSLIDKAINYGCFFSFNSQMLSTRKGKDVLSRIPRNRILTESDGPFASTSKQPSSPLNMSLTVDTIAKELDTKYETTKKFLYSNFKDLLMK